MKKIIAVATLMLLITNSFALDMSIDTSKGQNTSQDQSMSDKQSKEKRDNESQRSSTTQSKDKSTNDSKDLTKIGQIDVLEAITSFEEKNVNPFSYCRVLTKPKLIADFGITSFKRNGDINPEKSEVIEKSARNSANIESVGADENVLKDYMNCVSFYAGIIAQSLKTEVIDIDITDKDILKTYTKIKKYLASETCRFDKSSEIIACGPVKIKIDYEPQLIYSNIPIFKENTFYGYSLSDKHSISYSTRLAQEISKSKESSISRSKSTDLTATTKEGQNQDKSFKTNFSPRNWIDFK